MTTLSAPVHSQSSDLHRRLKSLAALYALELPDDWRLVSQLPDAPPDAAPGGVTLVPADAVADRVIDEEHIIPLPAWRYCRRFQEVRNLLHNGTTRDPLSYRSRYFAARDAGPLDALIYRELDLVQWFSGEPIVSVFASVTAGRAATIVVKLAGGAACSIEVATTLPARASAVDRHEVITRRGVVSDQVVDTTTRTASVVLMHEKRTAEYTDTDFELYGLAEPDVAVVRAAMAVVREPGLATEWRDIQQQVARLVRLTRESAESGRRLDVVGAQP